MWRRCELLIEVEVAIEPSCAGDKELLNGITNARFSRLETEQFNTVLDAMFEYPVEPNQKVIIEGDDGDNFYVIENGVYDVLKVEYYFSL